jgi:hypothetical protein
MQSYEDYHQYFTLSSKHILSCTLSLIEDQIFQRAVSRAYACHCTPVDWHTSPQSLQTAPSQHKAWLVSRLRSHLQTHFLQHQPDGVERLDSSKHNDIHQELIKVTRSALNRGIVQQLACIASHVSLKKGSGSVCLTTCRLSATSTDNADKSRPDTYDLFVHTLQ